MNREEIVALAEKAGFERLFPNNEDWVCFTEEIERFYKMVVAVELENKASKPWVGLTQDELFDVYNHTDWDIAGGWEYERAIEAKLREKNT